MPHQATSNEFEWTSHCLETFNFLGADFSVSQAKELIDATPRLIVELVVADWKGVLALVDFETPTGKIDLKFPCILAAVGRGHLPIDGWHRIWRATLDGVETLPAVKLTKKETKQIRID